ncbi:rab5 GDP/GTP exchange factor isoform X2 [Leptidea sinapis]|nr:rab5 GDP/GTP exchange factor isoform X2 [Leptidea sinapis]
MPTLNVGDLKCKNGCEFYGNPQWRGLCSECHRNQVQKQRRAEAAAQASAGESGAGASRARGATGVAARSSFSKFEEKRLKQSETLKKANLLKFSVFKKSNTASGEGGAGGGVRQAAVADAGLAAVAEVMRREFRARFPALAAQAGRDARSAVHSLVVDVLHTADRISVDLLSDRVQRHYQRFRKFMDTAAHFAKVDSEQRELLLDFVEEHAMAYLHDLPGVVFSPGGTDDERRDRVMSERIQQLGWVGERHLECKLDRHDARCRRLLYRAISELLGMDAAAAPCGKLRRVRRACGHVLELCAAPASADDLLPLLIFTVLKANPPRLVSNINYVTRFCNAQRLMTGEGGYYFTNLCCAVSFIENLSAESLSMERQEFECYMAMPASIGGSAWGAALSLCGAAHEADELRAHVVGLLDAARAIPAAAQRHAAAAETFEEEIAKKVQDVLAKTPLEIKPRRQIPSLRSLSSTATLIDLDVTEEPWAPAARADPQPVDDSERLQPQHYLLVPEIVPDPDTTSSQQTAGTPPADVAKRSVTVSPLGLYNSKSIDNLLTPDDFDNVAPGLWNINYDIDLSDFSGDNSFADDAPNEPKDCLSPEGLKKFDPLHQDYKVLDKFDEISIIDKKSHSSSEPFDVVHRDVAIPDPFSPVEQPASILDDGASPTSSHLLPSPLLPQSSQKHT